MDEVALADCTVCIPVEVGHRTAFPGPGPATFMASGGPLKAGQERQRKLLWRRGLLDALGRRCSSGVRRLAQISIAVAEAVGQYPTSAPATELVARQPFVR